MHCSLFNISCQVSSRIQQTFGEQVNKLVNEGFIHQGKDNSLPNDCSLGQQKDGTTQVQRLVLSLACTLEAMQCPRLEPLSLVADPQRGAGPGSPCTLRVFFQSGSHRRSAAPCCSVFKTPARVLIGGLAAGRPLRSSLFSSE